MLPYFFGREKVSKKLALLASRLRAVSFPHSRETLAKNSKLALLRQMSFFHAKLFLPFGFVDVLPHSSGNALFYSEAKASVKLPRRNKVSML